MRDVDDVWSKFLHAPDRGRHGVRIYREPDELAEAVALYLARGFDAGAPAVLVATPDHRRLFGDALARRGWGSARVDRHRLLAAADAEETLARVTVDGEASWERFEQVVGGLLAGVRERFPSQTIRVYGEMVDVLVTRGDALAAARLEELWNHLAATRDFSLLCAYRIDVFDRAAQLGSMSDVCRAHSHVVPAGDEQRFGRAVDAALAEVVGPAQAGRVYTLAVADAGSAHVPLPQLALLWVSRELPALSKLILASARRHYVADSLETAHA